MKQNIKYEDAVHRLEDIVTRMENNELDIDMLSEQLKTAQQLIKLCKDKLIKTDAEIKKLLGKGASAPKC
ncbi:exodeoxyribonuclease VII small subunit [Hoylesella pleuritidis]|uniref:Exodeoxyribonuclease VII small subunit n=1 Tax=Hoylesella pleuritidis F0068 TaxID=1081904 RepID=U2LH53_9BACT|nr:exodeoxyribonuclease VII small subunit [Hoylesella pleuritidis]ERK03591.1 exodeoxyribonuclease VII, small subunit [Hoylesella pleuritidis F0068]